MLYEGRSPWKKVKKLVSVGLRLFRTLEYRNVFECLFTYFSCILQNPFHMYILTTNLEYTKKGIISCLFQACKVI